MTAEELQRRRETLIREHGPWTNYNIHLGHGVFTIGPQSDGAAEQRVDRIVRVVEDSVRKPPGEIRVLDLACYEGAFALAFAERGASVLGLEAREEHVAKARFAAEALGNTRVEFEHADVRELSVERHGTFDVVLCLGILYHLDAPDCFEFLHRVADACEDLAVVETQVGLHADRTETWRGHAYRGRSYAEDPIHPGAAKDNRRSFWPTRPALINLMTDVGFTSTTEVLTPLVPSVIPFRDHVTFVGRKGGGTPSPERWPESGRSMAHPSQGWRYRVADRIATWRGGGTEQFFRDRS
jgi:SAM-dependent methyltransferase